MISELARIGISETTTSPVVTASLDERLIDVVRKMGERKFRRVPVLDSSSNVAGVLTATKANALLLRVAERELRGGTAKVSETLEQPVQKFLSYDFSKVSEDEDLLMAVRIMFRKASGYVLVFNDRGDLTGIVTERDVTRKIASLMTGDRVYFHMSRELILMPVHSKVIDVQRRMVDRGIRRIPIEEDGKPVGIVSETAILKHYSSLEHAERIREKGARLLEEETVDSLMYPRILKVFPEATLEYAADVMEKNLAGAVLIYDGERPIGILTERDLLRAAAGIYARL